jgi:hypothetical protein
MHGRAILAGLLVVAAWHQALVVAGRAPAQEPAAVSCASQPVADGDPDLYCIELLPPAGLSLAAGVARLRPAASPFGLAVTTAGAVVWDVDIVLPERPDPRAFAGAALVAWAATPQFDSEVKLGEVGAGTTRLRGVAFDRFLLLITAEPSPAVAERTGRLLLRGASAAVRMQPHDMAFVLAGLMDPAPPAPAPRRPRPPITARTPVMRCRPSPTDGSPRRCIRTC